MTKKSKETFLGRLEDEVVEGTKNLLNGTIKRRILRFGEFSLFLILSIFMFVFGFAYLLGKFVPVLNGGFNFIILGALFLIISLYLK